MFKERFFGITLIVGIILVLGFNACNFGSDEIPDGNNNGSNGNDNGIFEGTWVNEFGGFWTLNKGIWEGGSNGIVDVKGTYTVDNFIITGEQIHIRGDFFDLDPDEFYSIDEVKSALQMADEEFAQKYPLLFRTFIAYHFQNEEKIVVDYNNVFFRKFPLNEIDISLNGKWCRNGSVELELNNGAFLQNFNIMGTYTTSGNNITFEVVKYLDGNRWYTKNELVNKYLESGQITQNRSAYYDVLFVPQVCTYTISGKSLTLTNKKTLFYFSTDDVLQIFTETITYTKTK